MLTRATRTEVSDRDVVLTMKPKTPTSIWVVATLHKDKLVSNLMGRQQRQYAIRGPNESADIVILRPPFVGGDSRVFLADRSPDKSSRVAAQLWVAAKRDWAVLNRYA